MTDDPRSTEYSLTRDQAMTLGGASGLPRDIRAEIFRDYADKNGVDSLATLFAEFMGLANSVVANNREAIELFGIVEGGMTPRLAEQLNLPTIFGACSGAALALDIDQQPLCGGCAFRVGTPANQSPITSCDADYCSEPGEIPFMCHEDLDEKGNPTKGCAGSAQLRAARRKAA